MPFTLRRINGSPFDLPAEKSHLYQEAMDVAKAYGKAHLLRPAVVAQLVADFEDHAVLCIERWCVRQMTSLDSLQDLCEGKMSLVFERPKTNEMPGKDRINASEPVQALAAFGEAIKAARKTKLPQGWMTREMMNRWMAENHPSDLDIVDDYFDYKGFTQEFGQVWILKARIAA